MRRHVGGGNAPGKGADRGIADFVRCRRFRVERGDDAVDAYGGSTNARVRKKHGGESQIMVGRGLGKNLELAQSHLHRRAWFKVNTQACCTPWFAQSRTAPNTPSGGEAPAAG